MNRSRTLTFFFLKVLVVPSLDVTLKCCVVAREGYDVENINQVSIDTRTVANSQIVPIQISTNLVFFRTLDHIYYLRAEVNAVSTDSAITRIILAQILEIAQDHRAVNLNRLRSHDSRDSNCKGCKCWRSQIGRSHTFCTRLPPTIEGERPGHMGL